MLTEAVIAITYRCNARCLMCDIWKKNGHSKEMGPEAFKNLPRSLRHINITGGEPFLREDICDVVRNVKNACPKATIVISTNGLLTKIIEERMSAIKYAGLRVSIDGLGPLHNKIRGRSDVFGNAVETITMAKRIGIKNLGIGFTATKFNIGCAPSIKKLADNFGVEFTCAIAHSSEHYFGDQKAALPDAEAAYSEFKKIQALYLKSRYPKDWFRAYFADGLTDYAKGVKRKIKCGAARMSFYMDPYGYIFPCNILNVKAGNIMEDNVEDMFNERQGVQIAVKGCTHNCWMVCTAAPAIRKNPFPAICWIIKNKFK